MNNRKWILCIALMMALMLTLAACMNDAGTTQPKVTTGYMPELTQQPMPSPSAAADQDMGVFDWLTGAGVIEGNINRISEIQDSRVVVNGNTALVAVKFTNAYQGEMTERIREMIAGQVKQADPAIQTVAVTAEGDDVTKVYDISEKIHGGEPADSLAADIERIVRNATTLR